MALQCGVSKEIEHTAAVARPAMPALRHQQLHQLRHPGVVGDDQQVRHARPGGVHDAHEVGGARQVERLLAQHAPRRQRQLARHDLRGLLRAARRAHQQQVRHQLQLQQPPCHRLGGRRAAPVERPLEVGDPGVLPARIGVTHQGEALHAAGSSSSSRPSCSRTR